MRRVFAFCLMALGCCPSVSFAVTDEFDDDPTLGGDWEFYDPMGQSITSTQDGYFRYTFPLGVNMDHWVGIDNAAQLRRNDIPGDDFIVETRVNFVGSGDPEAPFWPPADEPYHAALAVAFGATDLFYWGFYRSYGLYLERSGQNNVCIFNPGIQELSLQIKKVGTSYDFSWRETDDQPWNLVCTVAATQTPVSVGLIFKTWGGLTSQETFDFDYFELYEVPDEAPDLTFPCPLGAPDHAWRDMPYVRDVEVTGYPIPTLTVTQGPEDIVYDPAGVLAGWVPDTPGTVPIAIEFESTAGTIDASWDVSVTASSILRDDDFESDPRENPGLWTLHEMQTGVQYSAIEDAGSTWWRMQVPLVGDSGAAFDAWAGGLDNAPQLQTPVAADDFLIETRVRIDPEAPPPTAQSYYQVGLLVNFDGLADCIFYGLAEQRTIGGQPYNVLAERSGTQNVGLGYVPDILTGAPVELRMEKRCGTYSFFFRGEDQASWTYAGSYRTATVPQYVGLVMKTWGGGVAFACDFDYFDFVEVGPSASFTITPPEGPEPLQVSVDGGASSSPGGAITAYEWDFGDGGTANGATAQHTYASRGQYVVQLTVTDAAGDKGAIRRRVNVLFGAEDVPPWTATDIGAPVTAGGARFDGGCLHVLAGGSDIGGTSDQFHFLYQSLTGDGRVVARVSEANWSVNGAKVGVMIREDLTPGSRHAAVVAQKSNTSKYAYLRRIDTGGSTSAPKFSADAFALPNAWVKMERAGDELIGSYSADGVAWTEVDRVTIALPPTVYAGIALSAYDRGQTGVEVLADVCDASVSGGSGKPVFHRGDANDDGGINITDGIFILNFLFLGGADPTCMEAANPNDDEAVNITDGIFVLNFLFLGGAAPLPPGPIEDPCGPDPDGSPNDLTCESYSNC